MTTRPAPTVSVSPSSASTWRRRAARHPVLAVSVTLAGVTLLAAIGARLEPDLGPATTPRPTLHGSPGEALWIAAHNARSLIAPLLLIAGRWHTTHLTRPIGDAVVTAVVIANATLVGLALGRYPTQLPAYLPHLPLEDSAVAIAAGAWLAHRLADPTGAPAPRLARAAVLTAAVTIAAAIVETYAVPHKG
jgi:hypothetical protein